MSINLNLSNPIAPRQTDTLEPLPVTQAHSSLVVYSARICLCQRVYGCLVDWFMGGWMHGWVDGSLCVCACGCTCVLCKSESVVIIHMHEGGQTSCFRKDDPALKFLN